MKRRPTTLVIANIAWDFAWQRHQTLASLFARDSEVVFCEVPGIRRLRVGDAARVLARWRELRGQQRTTTPVPAGLRIARPWLLPATNRACCALNARLIARWLAREPDIAAGVDLIWNYSPSRSARELIARVPHRRLACDWTDDWLAVRGIPAFLAEDERALLAAADLTLVPSRALAERKGPLARRLERVPHGALVERFLVEPRLRAADEPVRLLYYGHLLAQHFDFAAMDTLARARPAWRIMLVGPVKTPHAFPPNVELAGPQPHERLREFVRTADGLLLPYALNDYTRAVLPAKIYECLATGRPIVAAPLPELAEFSAHLRFAAGPEEWATAVEAALAADTPAGREARIALARANTWESRYARIRALLGERDAPGVSGRAGG
ncbi:MAG TPA: glycosyltransferase [Opitutus sp.]|nr:glycosyltransferase [Opitutus sp.]